MSEYKRPELERHADGVIKDFSIPEAHTLFVSCRSSSNPAVAFFRDTFVLFSLDELDKLNKLVDPDDMQVLGEKWCVDEHVIKELKSRGDSSRVAGPMVYTYHLQKTLNADNLKHKG